MARQGEITALLQGVRNGEDSAMERLLPLVYDDLRRIAHRQLAGERQDHTVLLLVASSVVTRVHRCLMMLHSESTMAENSSATGCLHSTVARSQRLSSCSTGSRR